MKRIVKLFKNHSCAVFGEKGSGKDMLFANVVCRRNLPYISNTDYHGKCEYIPFKYSDIDCNGNTYVNFIKGDVKPYVFPYADGTDIYLADVGVYFPSQYCGELNRDYKQLPIFEGLSRHLGDCRLHYNTQALNRCYDKIREQCGRYILCVSCHVFFGWVFQRVIVYDKYSSAEDKVLPYQLKVPIMASKEVRTQYKLEYQRYTNTYGHVKPMLLIYRNKSKYDTRVFRTMMSNTSSDVQT